MSLGQQLKARLSNPYDAELLALSVPALMAMMLDPITNMIAAAMMGHLGTQQLGAASLGNLAVSFSQYTFSFLVFLTTPRVAAAAVAGDAVRVSRQAAVGMWLAALLALPLAATVFAAAPAIVTALRPPEASVAVLATDFIRLRCFGTLGALLGFVATGTLRGVKDTRTPLVAAAAATATSLALNCLFIYGLGWGVRGAALASSGAQWVSAGVLVSMLLHSGLMRRKELLVPPKLPEILPYFEQGIVLSARMVITLGMVMFASALCVRNGATSQAAFEIIRQLWILSIQLFESLNVAAQSMCATFLGAGNVPAAAAVLRRALLISVGLGLAIGATVWTLQTPLVGLFTSDAAVTAAAAAVLPLIAFFFPLDAAASILDGGFIAASQTNLLSVIQIAGSLLQWAVLTWIATHGLGGVTASWAVLKLQTLVRLGGGYWGHFASPWSAYRGGGARTVA